MRTLLLCFLAGSSEPVRGAGVDVRCDAGDKGACFGNGVCSESTGQCLCDPAWQGAACDVFAQAPVDPAAPGYRNASNPVWGGTVIQHGGEWHIFMGGEKLNESSNSARTRTIRAVSTKGPSGPYTFANEVEAIDPSRLGAGGLGLRADVHRAPNGSLVLFTSGSLDGRFGLLALVSTAGSPAGPWLPNLLYRVQLNATARWDCGQIADASASIAPDGSLLVVYRTAYNCAGEPLERIGLLHSPHWAAPLLLTHVTSEETAPLFGFNVSNEDPFLWRSSRGVHMLLHTQGSSAEKPWPDSTTRGAVAFCPGDGRNVSAWRLSSNEAWTAEVHWTNGSKSATLRRQRPSVIQDESGNLTHLITGVNFESSNWRNTNADWTLVTPLLQQPSGAKAAAGSYSERFI